MKSAVQMDRPQSPGYVRAELLFSVPQDGQAIVYLAQNDSTTLRQEPRTVEVTNARHPAVAACVSDMGFELIQFSTALEDVLDKKAVTDVFYPEVEAMLKAKTGCDRVVIVNAIGRDMRYEESYDNFKPAQGAHVDHDGETYEKYLKLAIPEAEADELLKRHWMVYNVWKPIVPVDAYPLAVCDARTIRKEDLVYTLVGTKPGEPLLPRAGYGVTHNSAQRWYYYPKMTAQEALLIKLWDTDPTQKFLTAHTAFADPGSGPSPAPRISIDVRCLLFF